jgi:Flp pilus assembly protein TadD
VGQFDQALADLSRALELEGKRTDALFARATAYARLGKWDEALADRSRLLELVPRNPVGLNNVAWLLATCPEERLRDPKRAVELARKAVELAAKEGNYWNTLGAAEYRAGNWKGALEAVEKSMALRQGGDAFDWFFLAMAHRQLGDKDQARKWHDQAVQWMEKNKPDDEELRRFRAESETVLELKQK